MRLKARHLNVVLLFWDFMLTQRRHCKFGNFRENFNFANSVKRQICDVKISRPGHDLPISVNDRNISPYCESFNAKFRENKTLPKISEFTVNGIFYNFNTRCAVA